MALSEEQRNEIKGLFSDAVAEGFAKWRSAVEEEDAKKKQANPDKPNDTKDKPNDSDGGFDLAGWFLGERTA